MVNPLYGESGGGFSDKTRTFRKSQDFAPKIELSAKYFRKIKKSKNRKMAKIGFF